MVEAAEVDGGATAGPCFFNRLVVLLEAADSYPATGGQDGDLCPLPQRPAHQGSRDHRAEARHGEGPVDRQARAADVGSCRGAGELAVERRLQVRQPLAGHAGGGDDRRPLEGGSGEQGGHLLANQRQPWLVHQVRLGEDHEAVRDAQEVDDGEVLSCLRPRALIGRDHEQHGIHAMHAGQHVFEKALMTRHVDEPHPAAAGQRHVGEAEVDGHATALLLLQPVRVDLGQRLDERRFPVIDVTGGPDHERRAA